MDNVCAWPNLTLLRDGTIAALVFNQPSHARAEGDVECWTSANGEIWKNRGTVTAHAPMANRMNVGVGLTASGNLVALVSGWTLKSESDAKISLGRVIPPCAASSSDGGAWIIVTNAFPAQGKSTAIPFGDIFPSADGGLRGVVYGSSNGASCVWLATGDAEGKVWQRSAVICAGHNETTIFPISKSTWLAAARRDGAKMGIDLFRSKDDGRTWQFQGAVGGENEGPADIIRLADGRLLLSTGNRNPGRCGVIVRFSGDDGKTWTAARTLVDDLLSPDCGYPSSVQRRDGTVVTAYYARSAPNHQRYHMGVVLWSPKAEANDPPP